MIKKLAFALHATAITLVVTGCLTTLGSLVLALVTGIDVAGAPFAVLAGCLAAIPFAGIATMLDDDLVANGRYWSEDD